MPYHLLRNEDNESPFEFVAHVPNHIGEIAKPPLIVFLHGSGERGSDPGWPLKGAADVFDNLQLPAVVIFPQCNLEYRAFYGAMEQRCFAAIEQTANQFDVDLNRVYLIGYSMGGSSSMWLAARHPNKFAGMICIAPGITWLGAEPPPKFPEDQRDLFEKMFVIEQRPAHIAYAVKNMPVWFLQGTHDEPCPIDETRAVVQELKKLGREPIMTEYEGADHETLVRSLYENGLFQWLLSKRKAEIV